MKNCDVLSNQRRTRYIFFCIFVEDFASRSFGSLFKSSVTHLNTRPLLRKKSSGDASHESQGGMMLPTVLYHARSIR